MKFQVPEAVPPADLSASDDRHYRSAALVAVADAAMAVVANLDATMDLSLVEITLGLTEALLRCTIEKNRTDP